MGVISVPNLQSLSHASKSQTIALNLAIAIAIGVGKSKLIKHNAFINRSASHRNEFQVFKNLLLFSKIVFAASATLFSKHTYVVR